MAAGSGLLRWRPAGSLPVARSTLDGIGVHNQPGSSDRLNRALLLAGVAVVVLVVIVVTVRRGERERADEEAFAASGEETADELTEELELLGRVLELDAVVLSATPAERTSPETRAGDLSDRPGVVRAGGARLIAGTELSAPEVAARLLDAGYEFLPRFSFCPEDGSRQEAVFRSPDAWRLDVTVASTTEDTAEVLGAAAVTLRFGVGFGNNVEEIPNEDAGPPVDCWA